jgi:hypothetical protein
MTVQYHNRHDRSSYLNSEIVVITEKPLPKPKTKMEVKGTVKEAFFRNPR